MVRIRRGRLGRRGWKGLHHEESPESHQTPEPPQSIHRHTSCLVGRNSPGGSCLRAGLVCVCLPALPLQPPPPPLFFPSATPFLLAFTLTFLFPSCCPTVCNNPLVVFKMQYSPFIILCLEPFLTTFFCVSFCRVLSSLRRMFSSLSFTTL